MDEIVLAALRKWPRVPHCHGWLALDARGDWYMRDDATQIRGPFPQSRGSRIEHRRLIEFIGRNYAADEHGAWFFQNGPQRVYVDLEAAPWVLRWPLPRVPGLAQEPLDGTSVAGSPGSRPALGPDQPLVLTTHTGLPAEAGAAWLDEDGRLFIETQLGLGIVHSMDMHAAADAVEVGHLAPEEAPFEALIRRYGVQRVPRPT